MYNVFKVDFTAFLLQQENGPQGLRKLEDIDSRRTYADARKSERPTGEPCRVPALRQALAFASTQ
jgi:hypothetical protein